MPQFGNTQVRLSAPIGGNRHEDLMGTGYDDLDTYGQSIKFDHPITQLEIYHGALVDGIRVTYNTRNGPVEVMHGAQAHDYSPYVIGLRHLTLSAEITGVWGRSMYDGQGDQIHEMTFKIHDSNTGLDRYTQTMGNGSWMVPDTRQDFLVTGKLAGFAGQANNQLGHVGLNMIQFYTEIS
ncbi:hypothetical protein RhiJN_17278 [Ceratobasidium sp. AG-Ba]|nr:hypothetical protein RhiJN_17278 [Ceratobasidium sp. AG-Ba]